MEELQIKVSKTLGTIETNFSEIEKNLKVTLEGYKGIVVTEDTLKESKKDVAELRKLRTSIDDEKKAIKKAWIQPYTEFENKCKELMALVDEPIAEINNQVAKFESKQIEEKKQHFNGLYLENIEDYMDYLPFEMTLNDKWQNKTFADKDYLYELSEKKTRIKADLDAISSLESEIESELIEAYKRNGNNLSAAIQRNNQYMADKNRVKDQVKEEIKKEIQEDNQAAFSISMPAEEANAGLVNMNNACVTSSVNNAVKFIVSAEDADKVRQFLEFSEITYTEE
jgi:hypothetical protein